MSSSDPKETGDNMRTVVITGGTGGIGFQSALGIAKQKTNDAVFSYRLIITGRNLERGEAARQSLIEESGNQNIQLVTGDTSSIKSVDTLADNILQAVSGKKKIDVLIHNAGYFGDEMKTNEDGVEMHFAVNVVAPWRLTKRLLPTLLESAPNKPRVITVTGGDQPAAVDVDNLQAEKGFKGLMTYAHSKSALEAVSMALARELEPQDITVNVVFPGRASTNMTQSLSIQALPGIMKLFYPIMWLLFREDGGKSAAKAAKSTIWAATNPDLDGVTGKYYDTNCKETKLHPTTADPQVQAKVVAAVQAVLPDESSK